MNCNQIRYKLKNGTVYTKTIKSARENYLDVINCISNGKTLIVNVDSTDKENVHEYIAVSEIAHITVLKNVRSHEL